MPHLLPRATALVAAVLSVSLATSAAGAVAQAGDRVPAATPGAAPGAAPATSTALGAALTLVTGDRVLASSSPAGPRTAAVWPAPGTGQATSVAELRAGGQGFVIPLTALPYLGHGLDLSLFDVNALLRTEQGGRLPVTLRYRGRRPAVPGIIVTQVGPGAAQGYLTPASAARFGAALARQTAAGSVRGGSRSGGLFAGGLSIALAGTSSSGLPGSAGARPDAPTPAVTITVTGTDLNGEPDTGGLALVGDVDNENLPSPGLDRFTNGTAMFTGPPGTYWALAVFPQTPASGKILSFRMDVLPQFTVTGNTTVHLTAAAATSKITMVTPRPAITQSTTLTLVRAAPHAPANGLSPLVDSFGFGSSVPLWVNPVGRPPGHGTLRVFTSGQLTSPPGPKVPYAYTLDFADPPGTIPPQHFAAGPANLAVVTERYFQDLPSVAGWITSGGTAYQIETSFIGGDVFPLPLPTRQVQYLSASPAMLWQCNYSAYRAISAGQTPGGQTSAFRLLHPGQQLTQTWGQYPLHPGPNVSFPGTSPIVVQPSADRAGGTLNLDITPFSDNQPGDTGDGWDVPFPATVNQVGGSYAVYQNGVQIAGGAAPVGDTALAVSAALSPRPALVKLVLTASRASSQYRLSAISSDVWTWHSRPQPGATVPAPWLCNYATGLDRDCAVQPMITLDYQVARLGLDGAACPGRQAITITAGHIQLAPSAPLTRLQAQVSLNGGQTWRPAQVRPAGPDRFGVTFSAPPSAPVSLRVTAMDTAGNSLTETILNAYRTSA
jgi:hypothetical protein